MTMHYNKCHNKIWIENISELFCNSNLIPLEGMSLEGQLNSITRLVFVTYLIILLLRVKNSTIFLLLSLLLIIILYYIQRKQMEHFKTENYKPLYVKNISRDIQQPIAQIFETRRPSRNTAMRNIDSSSVTPDEYISENQLLSGPPNPKTLIAPIVMTPLADTTHWRVNNLYVPSGINEESNTDLKLSGYEVSDHTKNISKNKNTQIYEGYDNTARISSSDDRNRFFTQIIQPGIYSKNENMMPILQNTGLSRQDQFHPLSYEYDDRGNLIETQGKDQIKGEMLDPYIESINESTVYDPRHYGYGTDYRSYVDPTVGQPRFFYDDINSVRMPNYLTRNKVDFIQEGTTYGPIKQTDNTEDIRDIAQNAWINNTNAQRADLQFSLMRKNNSEAWQRKMYPIRTNGFKGSMMARR